MADSKLTALTEVSVPDLDDLNYLVDVSDTTDDAAGSSRKVTLRRQLALCGITPGGRITLESGVPVSTSNQTSKSTIYYTPYAHDWVRLYDGTRPKLYQFTERSLSLSGLTSGKNYDVFLYDNSGTLTLELSSSWTNDTTRANALAWQAGVGWVKSGTATRLWLGTIRTTGTTTTELVFGGADTAGRSFIWNAYNRVCATFAVWDTTDSWTYTTDSWRQKRASSNNQVGLLAGATGGHVCARTFAMSATSGSGARINGVGYDSTSALASGCTPGWGIGVSGSTGHVGEYSGFVGLGYHYLADLEYAAATATATWYGDVGVSFMQTGFRVQWEY